MLRLFTTAMLVNLLTTLPASVDAKGASPMTFSLTSPAFGEGGEIPTRYTCEDQVVSPPLAWSEPPRGTRSLALIVDDPDAPDPKTPKMTWVHWVLYNLPPTAGQLAEAVERKALPTGTRKGLNDWKRAGYGGPCPPIGRHRYLQGHVLAQAELVGTYEGTEQARPPTRCPSPENKIKVPLHSNTTRSWDPPRSARPALRVRRAKPTRPSAYSRPAPWHAWRAADGHDERDDAVDALGRLVSDRLESARRVLATAAFAAIQPDI